MLVSAAGGQPVTAAEPSVDRGMFGRIVSVSRGRTAPVIRTGFAQAAVVAAAFLAALFLGADTASAHTAGPKPAAAAVMSWERVGPPASIGWGG
jgi:hypothetical protein